MMNEPSGGEQSQKNGLMRTEVGLSTVQDSLSKPPVLDDITFSLLCKLRSKEGQNLDLVLSSIRALMSTMEYLTTHRNQILELMDLLNSESQKKLDKWVGIELNPLYGVEVLKKYLTISIQDLRDRSRRTIQNILLWKISLMQEESGFQDIREQESLIGQDFLTQMSQDSEEEKSMQNPKTNGGTGTPGSKLWSWTTSTNRGNASTTTSRYGQTSTGFWEKQKEQPQQSTVVPSQLPVITHQPNYGKETLSQLKQLRGDVAQLWQLMRKTYELLNELGEEENSKDGSEENEGDDEEIYESE